MNQSTESFMKYRSVTLAEKKASLKQMVKLRPSKTGVAKLEKEAFITRKKKKNSWVICTNLNLVAHFSTFMQVNQEVLKITHSTSALVNAQLPLSCTRWCLICSLPFTCIWHTQPLSKTKCNSTRQRVMWYTAMSYLQSLLDNTCPRFQHGRFSESCQIPNQLLPSCLKLLGYLAQ